MKITNFPGCCTAHIISNLGGSDLSAGRKSPHTKAHLRGYLNAKIDLYSGRHCLVVITNNQQTAANAVLKELGFKGSAWMSKKVHPESKIKLWWKEP